MNPVQADFFAKAVELHKAGKYVEAEPLYNRLLNGIPQDPNLLFCLSDLYLRREYNGLAGHLLSQLLQMIPDHAQGWCNLGIAHRKENRNDLARQAWEQALKIAGDTTEVCSNMAGLYCDMSQPEDALHWVERALKVDPQDNGALWNKSLALLTQGKFEEGWKLYRHRQQKDGWHSREHVIAPQWDGKPVDHLYIHGEQGVGDEIMFASAIPHMLGLAKRVTLEVNAKVAGIAKQTWPDFHVVKEELAGVYDAKIPIGSLIGMFGHNTKPFLNPHPEKVAFYRRELEKMGPGPYVALTWLGGTKETRALERSLTLSTLKPITDRYTCVSAQYSLPNTFSIIEQDRLRGGLKKINNESCGDDLHDQAALFKAVDAVVTVQQTAVHVAGGVGAKTFALIGKQPHWRYGIDVDRMPFYGDVRLFRKKDQWEDVVERVLDALERELSGAEQATA